jgi:peptidoglycan/LPS O-acetylase OafA/YrhL
MVRNQTLQHIAGLDGLRAVAALAVFGVHFNQTVRFNATLGPIDVSRLFENGEYGVSLFFSLSGFLLGLPFWQALSAGRELPRFKVYAVRRLARILPAYYGALTLLIALSGLWRYPAAYTDIALHYTFLFNFAEFSIFSINAPFWTLAVEMQFYVLLPLIFAGLARVDRSWRVLLLVALCFVAYGMHYGLNSSVTRIIHWPFAPAQIWIRPHGAVLTHSLLAHLPHFLLGVIGGYLFLNLKAWVNENSTRLHRLSDLVFWCAFGVILALLATPLGDLIEIPYGRYGLPLVTLLLVAMIISVPSSRFARRSLVSFPLRDLGAISYGIYIYHLPCLTLVDRYMGKAQLDAAEHWVLFGSIGLVLTILAATVSFLLIEKPVLTLVRKRG